MKRFFPVVSMILVLSLLLSACAPAAAPATTQKGAEVQKEEPKKEEPKKEEVVTITMTYWGSPVEKDGVQNTARLYESKHPNIKINAIHVPGDYDAKLATMVAGNDAPDLAYVGGGMGQAWYQYDRWMDLTELYKDGTLPQPFNTEFFYYTEPGKTMGTPGCAEMPLLYYNKDIFDKAGVPYPPSDPEKAMKWADFVEMGKKLTWDKNGKHPGEEGFDPENIEVYAFNVSSWVGQYFAFLYSNNVDIISEDGKTFGLDSPEAIEVYQALSDIRNVDHIAPTTSQSENLPGFSTLLQTGKVAMVVEGQWMLLDFDKMKRESNFNFGIGVLPMFQRPATLIYCMPIGIFNSTKHKEETLDFYKFLMDPQQNDLFATGLWMPINKEYYTDESMMKYWIDNAAHPPEYKQAVVDYALCCSHVEPAMNVKNFGVVYDELIGPQLEQVWSGERPAAEVLPEIMVEANKKMAVEGGRWDK